mmetsp:Transcript_19556/g.28575  ORF Transcript_19556/g.28575 Transcript_19556/m.28575 type:complete len:202 (+) Transcript_19556:42-647(+)
MKSSLISSLVFGSFIHGALSWSPESVSRRDTVNTAIVGTCTTLELLSGAAPSLADNSDDYTTTSRGLKYRVTKAPNDPDSFAPQRAQNVKALYTLYLNGFPEDTDKAVKIDSSKGFLGEKPFGFLAGVGQVIKGWDLTIMEMREGEARKLIIPSLLGYGEKGAGGKIPGGATLYFDVELAEIGSVAKLGPEQYKWLEENPL